MKRAAIVAGGWVALAGCRESKPVPTETIAPALELSAASEAAWGAFVTDRCTERPRCRGCGKATPFEEVEVPSADDPKRAVAWIRAVVPELVESTYHPLWSYEFWELFDALPDAEQTSLLPELRTLAWHSFVGSGARRDWSQSAWSKLARLGDTEAIPPLIEVLGDEHDWVAQGHAALALAAFGPQASAAEDELQRIARTHWSKELRAIATHAVERLHDETARRPDPVERTRNPKDPRALTRVFVRDQVLRVERQREPWSFELAGRRIEFTSDPIGDDAVPEALLDVELADRFAHVPGIADWSSFVTVARPVAGGWVLGTDVGEFGGDGWWIDPRGEIHHLVHANIMGSVELGGVVYLLEGLRHLSIDTGAMYRLDEDAGRITLSHAFELPGEPSDVHVEGSELYVATRDGVGVLTADLHFSVHPYATRREAPAAPPRGYMDGAVRVVYEHDADVQRCLAPLKGRTDGCDPKIVPGVALWLEVGARGSVTDAQPFSRHEDPQRRPPTPEVSACLAAAASSWTFPSHDRGVVGFGYVFELGD